MSEDEDFDPVEKELTGKTEYTEGSVLPEKSTVSWPSEEVENQEQMAKEPPTEQDEEIPIGVEEQEKSTAEPEPTTTTPVEMVEAVLEPKTNKKATKAEREEEANTRRLFDQFNKHFQVSKIASDKTTNILKQIQKQLGQVERISINSNKQQVVIKQLAGQVKTIQKQLDRIGKSITSKKTIPSVNRKIKRRSKK